MTIDGPITTHAFLGTIIRASFRLTWYTICRNRMPPLLNENDVSLQQAFSFRLSRMEVLDLYTQGAVFPHMLRVGGLGDGIDEDTAELREARAKVCGVQRARHDTEAWSRQTPSFPSVSIVVLAFPPQLRRFFWGRLVEVSCGALGLGAVARLEYLEVVAGS